MEIAVGVSDGDAKVITGTGVNVGGSAVTVGAEAVAVGRTSTENVQEVSKRAIKTKLIISLGHLGCFIAFSLSENGFSKWEWL
jgi:hypothetical protein